MKTKLSKFLKDLGVTQAGFANQTGISHSCISRYCNGADIPKSNAVAIMSNINMLREAQKKKNKGRVNLADLMIDNIIGGK